MGFLRRFRESPEHRAAREAAEAERRANAAREAEAWRVHVEQQRAAAEQQRRADEQARQDAAAAAEKARVREILGPDLYDMEVDTPAQAKIAIKMARLRKKELQAKKRDLAADLADVREEWRERTAGRISTVGLSRGTTGRMIRAGVQAKRRSERQHHAQDVNSFSDARQQIDAEIAVVDRMILMLERKALGG